MDFPRLLCLVTFAAALAAGSSFAPASVRAQEMDFGSIGGFESMGAGTVHGGAAPKTIVDDGERHIVFLTIWDSDTDAKVFWKPLDGTAARTTVIHGTGVRAFQVDGEFKIQALGADDRAVKYDYVLLAHRGQEHGT